jgi:hypothetical protein
LSISAGGAWSQADATVYCPAAQQLSGSSTVTGLRIAGVGYDANQSQTITIPGVATIAINQQLVSNGTITQRALYIELPLLNENITVAESVAGIGCA